MKRHRHTPEQIVRKLREGERMLNERKDLAEVVRHLEIAESTWVRWRSQYGEMKAATGLGRGRRAEGGGAGRACTRRARRGAGQAAHQVPV